MSRTDEVKETLKKARDLMTECHLRAWGHYRRRTFEELCWELMDTPMMRAIAEEKEMERLAAEKQNHTRQEG